MEEQIEKVEISHSLKGEFTIEIFICIITLIIFSCIPLIWHFLSPDIMKLEYLPVLYFFIFFLILFGLFLYNTRKKMFMQPILEVKFSITKMKFEIFLQNRSYLVRYWDDLEKIELIREKYYISMKDFYGRGYRLNFICHRNNISVRLYHFHLKKEKVRFLVSTIKDFTKKLNIPFIEISKIEKADTDDVVRELYQIDHFRKKSI